MTIDERLQFLVQSTESLHASLQELHAAVAEQSRTHDEWIARQQQQEAKTDRLRRAMLLGIRTFLEENGGGEEGEA